MSGLTLRERLDRRAAACTPISEGGRRLLELYLAHTDFDRPASSREHEIVFLGEVCRLVEEVPLDEFKIETLTAAAARPAPSRTAAKRRRQITGRLIRILRSQGELPTARDISANRRILAILEQIPVPGAERLRGWLARRQQRISWFGLLWEARMLGELERLLAELPQIDDPRDAIALWLQRIVRTIADCECPPITRARSANACECCGKTINEGSRPSPGPRKQRELRSLALRYLNQTHPATWERAA